MSASEPKPLRTREEIERACEIMVQACVGANGDVDKLGPAAMGAIALGWVLGWDKVGSQFQEMIDACNAVDAEAEKKPLRHRHRGANG